MAMKPEEMVIEEADRANNVPMMEQGGEENAERIEEEANAVEAEVEMEAADNQEGANAVEAEVEMEAADNQEGEDAMARLEIPDLNLPTEEREEEEEETVLITVGCKGCYRYMMVPKNNKKCLNCGLGTSLFEIPKPKRSV